MNKKLDITSIKNQWALILATGFGVGFIPFAPGTWGSLLSIFLYLMLLSIPFYIFVLSILILTLLGIWSSDISAFILADKDPSQVVIDEIAGMGICLFLVHPTKILGILFCFLAFRIFDILKPFPIGYLEKKFKRGFGIMVDDFVSGIIAGVIVLIIKAYFYKFMLTNNF